MQLPERVNQRRFHVLTWPPCFHSHPVKSGRWMSLAVMSGTASVRGRWWRLRLLFSWLFSIARWLARIVPLVAALDPIALGGGGCA